MTYRLSQIAALAVLSMLNAGFLSPVHPSKPPHRSPPIVAALVDRLPHESEGYAAEIVRRAGSNGEDIILMRASEASDLLLDAATRTLLHSRALQGDHPARIHGKPFQNVVIGIRAPGHPPQGWAEQYQERAAAVLKALRAAAPRNIPGVGRVRAVTFVAPLTPGT